MTSPQKMNIEMQEHSPNHQSGNIVVENNADNKEVRFHGTVSPTKECDQNTETHTVDAQTRNSKSKKPSMLNNALRKLSLFRRFNTGYDIEEPGYDSSRQNSPSANNEAVEENYEVYLGDPAANHHKSHPSNNLRTTKYTIWTFLPVNLFEQFRRVNNIYFLITMIVALIPGVSPIFPVTSIFPLVFILVVSGVKDGIEDYFRYRADKEANSVLQTVIRDGKEIQIQTRNVLVGDIVKVERGVEFPADMILLSSSLEDCLCYIETANLDGESNLKVKRGWPDTATFLTAESFSKLKGTIHCESPNEQMYKFRGRLELKVENENTQLLPLNEDQLLLRGSRLKNTKFIYGVVVYTGTNTKLFKNLKQKGSKFSIMDITLNKIIVLLLILQQIVAIVFVILSTVFQNNHALEAFYLYPLYPYAADATYGFREWCTFFILLNLMIPMSLFVSLEIIKGFQAKFMDWDFDMMHEDMGAKAKTSNLNEDLSQIEYVFSDKTGTLTENLMSFTHCFIDDFMHDAIQEPTGIKDKLMDQSTSESLKRKIREFLICIAVCNNAVPDRNEQTSEISYDGPSTDEVALLDAASRNGFCLVARNNSGVTIDIFGERLFFEILALIEFTADRKRMSVLTRCNNTVTLYTKGADNMMMARMDRNPEQEERINTNLKTYSSLGLRTLLLGKRDMSSDLVASWLPKWRTAAGLLKFREENLAELAEEIERNLQILGGTAIEDRLQDKVPETIEYLIRAGLRVWVLTGDKRETAVNIAYSCRLIQPNHAVMHIAAEGPDQMRAKLLSCIEECKTQKVVMVIEGPDLTVALRHCMPELIQAAKGCVSCVCCRVIPLQKALMVRLVAKELKKNTLSIGDGANDVSMIQEASIGVGILGREGSQAARASDYAIPRFRHLSRLIAVHGRYSYLRNSEMILYSFYKNILVTVLLLMYCIFNGYSGQVFLDSYMMTFYNIIFTSFPPMAFGILEKDVKEPTIEKHPELYRSLSKGEFFNLKLFLISVANSIFHGVVIFFFLYGVQMESRSLLKYQGDDIWSIGTAGIMIAIVVVLFKSAILTRFWTYINHIIVWGSLLVFFVVQICYNAIPNLFGQGNIYYEVFQLFSSGRFVLAFILIPFVCLLPDFSIKYIYRQMFPSAAHIAVEVDYLNKTTKNQEVTRPDAVIELDGSDSKV